MVSGATIRSHSPNVFIEVLRHDLQVQAVHTWGMGTILVT
jgi:hypothetical protein